MKSFLKEAKVHYYFITLVLSAVLFIRTGFRPSQLAY